jgi:hypothetical protein
MRGLTQENLNAFKSLFPQDEQIQALTLQQVIFQAQYTIVDLEAVVRSNLSDSRFDSAVSTEISTEASLRAGVSTCLTAVGMVVFDCISLALGAVALRRSISQAVGVAMGNVIAPAQSAIEIIVTQMSAVGASAMDKAKGIFEILKLIYKGGMLGAVYKAFTANLTWWQAVIFGVTSLGSLVLAFATDGLALAAEIVLLLVGFTSLGIDLAAAVSACRLHPGTNTNPAPIPTPVPGTDPYVTTPLGALRTSNGNFITCVSEGGLHNDVVPLNTDRTVIGPWEKFTIEPLDQAAGTFALKAVNGCYLSAIHGGGMGGRNNASCPVHTDATKIGEWEKLSLVQHEDGSFSFCTHRGFYLTAVGGGGMVDNGQPVATNRTVAQSWETFSFVPC